MSLYLHLSRPLPLIILQLFICGGCASQAPVSEPPARAPLIEGGTSAVYPGPLDSRNHYLSNVAIHTSAKREDGSEHCSGVLISPRDILTAGHCVCMKKDLKTTASKDEVARRLREAIPSSGRSPAERAAIEDLKARILANADTFIDPSLCATLVRVEVVEYLPSQSKLASSLRQSRYIGKIIHPHPQLLVIDDARGTSWFREADLALIHLAAPVAERFRPIKLPEQEVETGNPIVMVGYGFGEDGDITNEFGDRHHGESAIAYPFTRLV
ncbi:MAG: trypsin-like serine protease [Myxococcaceae bacterium]|nr:trypsin-like serine protease [Myxococcaceae bacterium]